MRIRPLLCLAALITLSTAAQAQLESVPQRGAAGPWVKGIKIELQQDWEWVETYADRVFFATRVGATRAGDTVTMWTRVEYEDPQGTKESPYRSIASWDDWNCKDKRRGTALVIMYRYNNLEDSTPLKATNPIKIWENVVPDTVGETLLEFACGIKPTQELVPSDKQPPAPKAPAADKPATPPKPQ